MFPWQIKSIRIIKISYHKKPRNAVFWGILPTCFFYYKSYILSADFAKYGKTVQFTPLIRSKIVVKIFGIATLDFAPPWSISKPRGVHYLTKGCSNLIPLYCIIYFHFPTLHALFLIYHHEICMA